LKFQVWLFLLGIFISATLAAAPGTPNIVLIYADDIGYGDLGSYGASRVQTPNLDRLAADGLRFTDAHSGSATCTPSRYAMLTGQYAWRKKGTGVARGDANLIIDPDRATLASLLHDRGYRTGVVGKWHLGLGAGPIDWNGEIRPGPLELGFDYAFLIPATGDRVPCVYMENRRIVGLDQRDPVEVSFDGPVGDDPTGREHPELLKMHPSHGHDMTIVNGISRIGYMSGGNAARWVDEDMADLVTRKARTFIEESAGRPFFLYFSTHDIHVPRVPNARFAGASQMGPRGDAIAQLDNCVGVVLSTLERLNLTRNTLVIFTSDNGPVIDDGYQDGAVEKLGDHRAAGPFRGGKYSNFEGGTRVPLIVRWPERVKPGLSDALIGQVDFPASMAALVGNAVPEGAAQDSVNVLAALLGDSPTGRTTLVEHAGSLSLRSGAWKLIEPNDGPRMNRETNTELGNDSRVQLYNLSDDPGETRNLADEAPDRVRELSALLEQIRGRF
jgi:arylsulfatase A-like enzyme